MPQDLDERTDYQARTQSSESELIYWLGALYSLYQNGLAHHISNIHQDVLEQQLSEACGEEGHAK